MKQLIAECSVMAVLLLMNLSVNAFQPVPGELLVQLKDTARVQSAEILLRDVARVTCRDSSRQKLAESLEIRLLETTQESETITASSVKSRLLLAGWRLEEFRISGSPEVKVTFREAQIVTDAGIEAEAHRATCSMLGVEEKDLTVRLQNAFMQAIPAAVRESDGLRIEITPPTRKGLGLVNMQVQLWSDSNLVLSRSASFEVRKRHRVAVARVSLTRDVPLDERAVQFENRFLAAEMDELDPAQVRGRNVRANVSAGSILQMRDLQTTTGASTPLVKRGEMVQVNAMSGRLRTTLRNAEALQNGGLGETIELKNRESGQNLAGRVVGPGKVLIQIR